MPALFCPAFCTAGARGLGRFSRCRGHAGKYVPVFGGADITIAKEIEDKLPDLNLTRRDVEDMAYLCADETHDVPDSSLRHLLAVDRKVDQCAIEAHLLFLLGRPYAPLGLSHRRSPNGEFYEYCAARLAAWRTRSAAG